MMHVVKRILIAAAILPALVLGGAWAADRGTKAEAVAMVKKAVEYIKANGPEKAYAEITNKNPMFKDRDLYVLVYDTNGFCLAHGNNPKLIGKNNMEAQDADGVYYVKNRVELAKTNATFWQDYKFSDPLTKKIEPKSTYCERLNNTVVCVGIYKS